MGFFDRFRSAERAVTPLAPPPLPRDGQGEPSGSQAAVIRRLRQFVAAEAHGAFAADDIAPTEHLFDAGYIDSLSTTALVGFVHDEWGVRIADMDLLDRCSTLEALAAYVLSRRSH